MTSREATQLRALIWTAWPHRGTDALRGHVDAIEDWNALRAIARGELEELRTDALVTLERELRVRHLVWLLRESYPVAQ